MTFEVLQVRKDWFEVRLASGRTGWIWAPLVVAGVLIFEDRNETPGEDSGKAAVLLTTGRSFWVESHEQTGGVASFTLADGRRFIMDSSLIRWVERLNRGIAWDWSPRATEVEFHDGRKILAQKSPRVEDEAAIIELADGDRIITDASMVKGW